MNRSSVSAALAKAAANREQQNQLRRDLALRLERLTHQVEGLFTRSVEFRYAAIRQRRRAAVAVMLAPREIAASAAARNRTTRTAEPPSP